jgi:hypothetical protein
MVGPSSFEKTTVKDSLLCSAVHEGGFSEYKEHACVLSDGCAICE